MVLEMTWTAANAWAAGLRAWAVLPAAGGCRRVTDTGSSGCNFAYTGTDCGYNVNTATGEMAHMFYTTLGDKAYLQHLGRRFARAGFHLTNTGPFSATSSPTSIGRPQNTRPIQPSRGTSISTTASRATADKTTNSLYGWAVHSGNVGAAIVPLPAAVWLFGSGLLGLDRRGPAPTLMDSVIRGIWRFFEGAPGEHSPGGLTFIRGQGRCPTGGSDEECRSGLGRGTRQSARNP